MAASLQERAGIPDKSVPPANAAGRKALHRQPDSTESREDCIRESLIKRLKNVFADLTPENFEALVLKMTREQLRSEGVRWKKNDRGPC